MVKSPVCFHSLYTVFDLNSEKLNSVCILRSFLMVEVVGVFKEVVDIDFVKL